MRVKNVFIGVLLLFLWQNNAFAQTLQQDSLALVDLYNSTGGPTWNNTINNQRKWLVGRISNWYGVRVQANRVTEIELGINNLTGDLPESIGNLTKITSLRLNENPPLRLPTTIGRLKGLISLDLSNTEINFLPDSIVNLESLKFLNLESCQLSSLPENIGKLMHLESLNLNRNKIQNIPSSIGNIKDLIDLSLNDNLLIELPSSIGQLSKLKYLYVTNNVLTSLPNSITKLSNLENLRLFTNKITSLPDSIGNLNSLKSLSLDNNELSSIPESIWNLSNLNELTIDNNNLTTLPIIKNNLPNLYTLNISSNQITSLTNSIAKLTNLIRLNATSNKIQQLPDAIGQTKLQQLLIGNNLLSSLPESLNFIGSLYFLDISYNFISSLPNLSGLSHLSYAYIQENQLDFEDIETLTLSSSGELGYSPQKEISLNFNESSNKFSVQVGGTNNIYQWTMDDINIEGANDSILFISSSDYSQNLLYRCIITNNTAPSLTLLSARKRPQDFGNPPTENLLQQDSLALVTLYQSTGGDNWINTLTNNKRWLDGPLAEWYGVKIEDNRVAELDLGSNNLTGDLPESTSSLTNLKKLILNNNQLQSILTNLDQLIYLNLLNLADNKLTFEDLELLISNNSKEYYYTPQDSIETNYNSSPRTFSVNEGGSTNQYQWRKNEDNITGATDNTYVLPEAEVPGARYQCLITNNIVPGLTLYSKIKVSTIDYFKQDSLALVDIYNSTGGPTWSNTNNNDRKWLNGPVGSWFGVFLEDGRVAQLNLGGNNLKGKLPESLSNLKNLTALYLYNNEITSFPDSLRNLESLTYLNIKGNQISTLPNSIGNLTFLNALDLTNNKLTSLPPSIGSLKNLKFLILSDNQLTSLPNNLGDITSLTHINADNNQLNAIPESILNLTNLRDLRLNNNLVTALPASIGLLKNLKLLLADNNKLTSLPASIGELTSLQSLYVEGNQLTSLPESITSLSKLYDFSLSYNKLTSLPSNIGNLTSLSYLNINDNQITFIPNSIGNLTNLEWLNAANNKLQAIPSTIGSTSLFDLFLANNLLDSLPASISLLSNLYTFDVSGNSISSLPDLTNKPYLSRGTVNISDNKLDFEDIETINLPEGTNISYSPQKEIDLNFYKSSNKYLVKVGGTNNIYQWTKDGTNITGATDSTLLITSVDKPENALFQSIITNSTISNLTLYSEVKTYTPEVNPFRQDSLALVALYQSTDGANWSNTKANNKKWLFGPIANWYGVKVANGRVTELNLNSNNLTGDVSPLFTNLTALISLSLHNNNISSIDISTMPLLTYVAVSWNPLTTLTVNSKRNYYSLLTTLNLQYNKLLIGDIRGMPALKTCVFTGTTASMTDFVTNDSTNYYYQLTDLTLDNHKINSLNISGMPVLKFLDAHYNKITQLISSSSPDYYSFLSRLYLYGNSLNRLDISNMKALEACHAYNNLLTLFTSNQNEGYYSKLKDLYLYNNANLSGTIDISNMPALVNFIAYAGSLTQLTTSSNTGNPELIEINIANNKLIGTVDLSQMPKLQRAQAYNNQLTGVSFKGSAEYYPNLTYVHIANNLVTTIDLRGMPALNTLACTQNKLTNLDLSQQKNLKTIYLGTNVLDSILFHHDVNPEILHLYNNKLTSLDLSQMSSLTNFQAYNNLLTKVIFKADPASYPNLTYVHLANNKLTNVDLKGMQSLNTLACNLNKLKELNLSQQKNLKSIYANNNEIVSIIFHSEVNPEILHVFNNRLASLDLSTMPGLTNFQAYNNSLTNVSFNGTSDFYPNLTIIHLANNLLTTLDVKGMPKLASLAIYTNKLASIDLTQQTLLAQLYLYNNNFTFEDLEPLASKTFTTYQYTPQSPVDLFFNISNLTFSVSVGGSANQYRWFKNGAVILGATSSSLQITSAEYLSNSAYKCEIKSSIVAGLTLFSVEKSTQTEICNCTIPAWITGFQNCLEVSKLEDPTLINSTGCEGSLRWALLRANLLSGGTYIKFNVPGNLSYTLTLKSSLPEITKPVYIDGVLPGTGNRLMLVANNAPYKGIQLKAGSAGSVIKYMGFSNFTQPAIIIESDNNKLITNYIVNSETGVQVSGGKNTIIGGANSSFQNLFFFTKKAISLSGADNTIIKSNSIGAPGNINQVNQQYGIHITNSANVSVGGYLAGETNLISGQSIAAIYGDGATGLQVIGNKIGVDYSDKPMAKNTTGIALLNTNNAQIGGRNDASNYLYFTQEGINISSGSGNHLYGNTFTGLAGSGKNINLNYSQSSSGNTSKPAPVISSATIDGSNLILTGTSAQVGDSIIFYVSDNQGKNAEYTHHYAVSGSNKDWTIMIGMLALKDGYLIATTTDASSNTSEFATMALINNCPQALPTFTIGSCPGVSVDISKPVPMTVSDYMEGYYYEWDVNSDGKADTITREQSIEFTFKTEGATNVTVKRRFGNCSATSESKTAKMVNLRIEGLTEICNSQAITLKAFPADLEPDDYVWSKDGEEITGATGNSIQISVGGTYTVKVRSMTCEDPVQPAARASSAAPSFAPQLLSVGEETPTIANALNSKLKVKYKQGTTGILIFEKDCGSGVGGVGCGQCLSALTLLPGKKYIISAWAREDHSSAQRPVFKYEEASVKVQFFVKDGSISVPGTEPEYLQVVTTKGEIIDGWQRLEGEITAPVGNSGVSIILSSSEARDIYYDDIRIHPFDANMKSYVYDPNTLRLMAEMDENNYATFYEYDQEGKLIRIKKETERGIMTIQESRDNIVKK